MTEGDMTGGGMTEAEMTEDNAPEPSTLHTVSAGGFSAAADAFARDDRNEDLWFLSMVGAQTALKAISACLMKSKPDPAYLAAPGGGDEVPAGYQICRLAGDSQGNWTTRIDRLPSSRSWHMMLYTKMAEYAFENKDFLLLARNEEEAPRLHHRFLDRRLAVPLHQSWDRWLWRRGRRNGTITPLQSAGISAFLCTPDEEKLREDLSDAVAMGTLALPGGT